MRYVNVRDFRSKSASIWNTLKDNDEVIISSNGRPIALLSHIDEKNVDLIVQAFRKIKALLALDKLQHNSVKKGFDCLSQDAINEEIQAARGAKR